MLRVMDQTIRFVTTSDGVKLAYAASGKGPPLLKTANWLNHLEFDWQSPVWNHWFSLLSTHHTLYRYDIRGSGLSDWTDNKLSFDDQVADLECVADAAGLEKFALLGISQGASVAIEYAVRHPERVTHLVIHGGFARGWAKRGPASERAGRAWVELVRVGWGASRTDAYRRMFAELFIPGATKSRWTGSPSCNAAARSPRSRRASWKLRETSTSSHRLAQVQAPTLVMHPRGDVIVPFEQGRVIAGGIANAKFVEFDSAQSPAARERAGLAEIPGSGGRIPRLAARGAAAAARPIVPADSEDLAALTGARTRNPRAWWRAAPTTRLSPTSCSSAKRPCAITSRPSSTR